MLTSFTAYFSTPDEARDEFNVAVSRIVQQLNRYIKHNTEKFKALCYFLTHKLMVLSQEDKEKVANSKSITDVKNIMEPHWNWSSHYLLRVIIEKLKSTESLEELMKK